MTTKQQAFETLANTMVQNFARRNIEAFYCPDSQSAIQKAMEIMEEGSVISWGGSETIKECGLLNALRESGAYTLLDRDNAKTPEEKRNIFIQSVTSDYFLMSSNAVTIDGELVNIDGNGNRVACLIHGPEHVLVFAGMNKIVSDVDFAVKRVQNIATPANAARLHTKTPCGATGHCGDCQSPDCMCCQVVVTRRSRHDGRIKVFLIGEELGF